MQELSVENLLDAVDLRKAGDAFAGQGKEFLHEITALQSFDFFRNLPRVASDNKVFEVFVGNDNFVERYAPDVTGIVAFVAAARFEIGSRFEAG